jgi:hypothetical protein
MTLQGHDLEMACYSSHAVDTLPSAIWCLANAFREEHA